MRSAKNVIRREIEPDIRYRSLLVSRFINRLMLGGKKSVAQRILYQAMDRLVESDGEEDSKERRKQALEKFEQAIRNIMPDQEVRSRRVGGATYQVPMPVRHQRSEALAIRWIIEAARSRSGKPMNELLAEELNDAFNNTGVAYKKKEDTLRMAKANRAFVHFGWFNR